MKQLTIKKYTETADHRVIEKTVSVTRAQIKHTFLRYAKTYRTCYGYLPTDYSLSVEAKQYGGVTMETLKKWMSELN